MKVNKVLATILVASLVSTSFAGSIGRSSSSSSSSSSHSSSSSSSRPSTPSQSYSAPAQAAPSKPGGIGGTQASMGVRKSEVTAPVQNQVAQSRPSTAPSPSPGTVHNPIQSSPMPGYAGSPQPVIVQQSSGFGSAFTGSLMGSMIGNSMFNHGSGGTTVVNNGSGGYSQGPVAQSGGSQVQDNGYVQTAPVQTQQKASYSMWNFIGDLISVVILVALLVGIAWLFYKGYKMVSEYVNRERGIGPSQPFSPTQQFWTIQHAFEQADLTSLQKLLGPDLVDEATMDLAPSHLTLRNVSHEVVLSTPREFSVHYKFTDAGTEVNQVWHYEKFGEVWQLNGIENI